MIRFWMKYGCMVFLGCFIYVPSISCSQVPSLVDITLESLASREKVDYLVEHPVILPDAVKEKFARTIVERNGIKSFLFNLIDVKDGLENRSKLQQFAFESMDGAESHSERNIAIIPGPGFKLVQGPKGLCMVKGRSLKLIHKNVSRVYCHDTTDQFLTLAMKAAGLNVFKTFDSKGKIIGRAACHLAPVSMKIVNNSACITVGQNGDIVIYDIKYWRSLYSCSTNRVIYAADMVDGTMSLLTPDGYIEADLCEIEQLNSIIDGLGFESTLCLAYIMNKLRLPDLENVFIDHYPCLRPLIDQLPKVIRDLLIQTNTISNPQ